MILKKGEWKIKLPESVWSPSCELFVYSGGDPLYHPGSYAMMGCHISVSEIMEMRAKDYASKHTTFFAVFTADEMIIHPAPKEDTYARLRYSPSLKEI